jgi:outer membrane protein
MRTLVILVFTLLSAGAFAQTPAQPQKIGYVDMDSIFSQLPQYKQVVSDLKAHSSQLEAQFKAKSKEFEDKYRAYQAAAATMIDAVRKDKETELQQLQENIQRFQQDAQSSVQKKEADLMEPLIRKIAKAIKEVAKENGFSFVINAQLGGNDVLLFTDEKYDISGLVLKKMMPAPATAAQPK